MTNRKLNILCTDSNVTKTVKRAYNTLSDEEFLRRYKVHKGTYYDRVKRYGDPYVKAPLARIGKILLKFKPFK